jgi:RNA polymerase sigma factor (sigma-70 family)
MNKINTEINIEDYFKFVKMIVYRYFGTFTDKEDLIQQGNLCLLYAKRKFNPSKGFKFSTYAYIYVRRGIEKHIKKTSGVKMPSEINFTDSVKFLNSLCSLDKPIPTINNQDENFTFLDIVEDEEVDFNLFELEENALSCIEQILDTIKNKKTKLIVKDYLFELVQLQSIPNQTDFVIKYNTTRQRVSYLVNKHLPTFQNLLREEYLSEERYCS